MDGGGVSLDGNCLPMLETIPRAMYGGERGIGYRAGIEFETNFRLNLDTPGEGLIRTAFGLF